MALVDGDGEAAVVHTLCVDPCAARIVVEPLESADTVAQTVRLLDRCRVQIADWVPWYLRAAVARHHLSTHDQECCTRSCPQARTWVAQIAAAERTIVPAACTALPA